MNRLVPLVAAAIVLGVASAPARATSVQPGAACRMVGPDNRMLQYDSNGRAFNQGTTPITVVCPIARQNSAEGWMKVKVVVADRNQSQDIVCQAFSAQTDGLGYAVSAQSTQYSPELWQSETLVMGRPSFVRSEGSFYLTCTIPPVQPGVNASGIMSYAVSEPCEQISISPAEWDCR